MQAGYLDADGVLFDVLGTIQGSHDVIRSGVSTVGMCVRYLNHSPRSTILSRLI